jgi:putrescine transport system substrate-binding protein
MPDNRRSAAAGRGRRPIPGAAAACDARPAPAFHRSRNRSAMIRLPRLLAASLAAGLAGFVLHAAAQNTEPKVLNVYNWAEYIAPDTLKNFEKETGIKVRYDNYDTNEILHAKLIAGRTGYDIVVPSAHFAKAQIAAGLFQKLDKSLLPNWKNLDPALLAQQASIDPGNEHLVTWLWGYVTVGINAGKVKAALGGAPLPANPWDLIFKPEYASKLKGCGISVLDSASEVLPVAMIYAGKPPYSKDPKDYDAARKVLTDARPFLTRLSSSGYIDELANGQLCAVLGYSGDINIARRRAIEGKTGHDIVALIPPSGATLFFDSMAIPKDAPHPKNAHAFINYILRAEVHASLSNSVFYANPNLASRKFVDKAVADNPTVFLSPEDLKKMTPPDSVPQDIRRLQTRIFTNYRAGAK